MPDAKAFAGLVEDIVGKAAEAGRVALERKLQELQNQRGAAGPEAIAPARRLSGNGARLQGLGRLRPLYSTNPLARPAEQAIGATSALVQETNLAAPAAALTASEIRQLSDAFEKAYVSAIGAGK